MLSYGRKVSLASITMSCGLTAAMSLIFNQTIRFDMMVTGFVCAVVIDRVLKRVTGHYRRKLAAANQQLESRVAERTRERDVLRGELMVRDRMATAGMLAAGVSHEIRSPLTVLCLALDEARDDVAAGRAPDAAARLDDMSEAADRIAVILRDLSSLARPVDDPVEPIALGDVLDSACRLASYRFARGVTMQRAPLDVPPVLANASRLVQVILNLVVNAARATDPARPNTIAIAAVLDGAGAGDRVVVTVSDTGTGMDAATQARLFEPFFTTGADTGGTGLGLTICRSILERMGGSIAITSEVGVGTRVRVELRAAIAAARAA